MSNKSCALVLTVLSRHVGCGNGIGMKELARQLDLFPRIIRTYISDLREDGHAICGTPRDGYYIAATADELQTTCDFLHNRAMHSLTLEAKLKRIPLADLIGQLHIPT
ncbi:MAG: HTH domain-containing protein [Sulfurimicrobium sp.]|nr:HTH domain-containing protein [Gallionella sp.]MDP1898299.1 HTH domain-containing protein [Sulfurimicrobium sp.]